MTFPDITPDLKAAMPTLRGRLLANQSLAELTWFRVGGPAQVLFTPSDEDDLAYFLKALPAELPVTVVGVGSNLIVRDGGIPGVVIRLSPRAFGETAAEGDVVSTGTAALDKRVAETAAAANIGGMEFFFGIPGTIGGALRMNAGANGSETRDVLVEATGIGRDGTRHVFGNADMKFVYRNSGVDPSIIFTAARFRGTIAAPEAIRARMNEVQTHRETAQPIREKTGGSTFQNPPGHSAWKLIDAAGCRGLRVGGAQVSEMHCNFLINTGAATGHDIETLGETVRARVRENSGIFPYPRAHGFAEGFDIMAGRRPGVDQEIAVHLRHLGAADAQAAAAGGVDQLPGAVAGRILEGRSPRFFANRLRGLAVSLHFVHPRANGFGCGDGAAKTRRGKDD